MASIGPNPPTRNKQINTKGVSRRDQHEFGGVEVSELRGGQQRGVCLCPGRGSLLLERAGVEGGGALLGLLHRTRGKGRRRLGMAFRMVEIGRALLSFVSSSVSIHTEHSRVFPGSCCIYPQLFWLTRGQPTVYLVRSQSTSLPLVCPSLLPLSMI